jgi:hypothetical protein
VHAVSFNGTVTTLNGLTAGQYQAPNFEFVLPENLGVGSPVVPGNFDNMPFLVNGSGPRGGAFTGQLSPWPGAGAAPRAGCAVVAPDVMVDSGSSVTLDGSGSVAANEPNNGASYVWSQQSGQSVVLANANTPSASFTTPKLAVGAPNAVMTFKLTATPNNGAPSVDSRIVTVTATAPRDTVAPSVNPPMVTQSISPMKRGTLTTLTTTATDNVAVASVTFAYTYTVGGVTQNGTAVGTKSTTSNTWTATFTPASSVPSGTVYTFTATAADTATPTANRATSTATTKSFQ